MVPDDNGKECNETTFLYRVQQSLQPDSGKFPYTGVFGVGVFFFFFTKTVITSYSLHSLQPFRAIPWWFMTLIPNTRMTQRKAMLLSILTKSSRFHVGGAVMRKLEFSCLCVRGVLFWTMSYDKNRHDFTDKDLQSTITRFDTWTPGQCISLK